jgi:hypothetical protein
LHAILSERRISFYVIIYDPKILIIKFVLLLVLITSIGISAQLSDLNVSYGQIAIMNNTEEDGKYQNFSSDFRLLDDIKNWKIISGIWNASLDGYQGSLNESDDTPTPVNAILSPINSSQSLEISTSFEINEIADQNLPYISLIYDFQDPFNYRQAGINIQDGNFSVFANTIDDNVTTDIFSSTVSNASNMLTSGDSIPMTLILNDSNKTLFVNGIEFPITLANEDADGKVGLGYGGMKNITFQDFSAQSVTSSAGDSMQNFAKSTDTLTIPLNDISISENSYIPLYDSRPYIILDGHIAAKLPCNDETFPDVQITTLNASELSPIKLTIIPELSNAGSMCLYHGDISFGNDNHVYDIIMQNNSTDDVDFTSTSGITISIAKLSEARD